MGDTSVHRGGGGEIDVEMSVTHLAVECSSSVSSFVGIPSDSQALLVQGSAQAAEWSSVRPHSAPQLEARQYTRLTSTM